MLFKLVREVRVTGVNIFSLFGKVLNFRECRQEQSKVVNFEKKNENKSKFLFG